MAWLLRYDVARCSAAEERFACVMWDRWTRNLVLKVEK
jgi:hypothetical protein